MTADFVAAWVLNKNRWLHEADPPRLQVHGHPTALKSLVSCSLRSAGLNFRGSGAGTGTSPHVLGGGYSLCWLQVFPTDKWRQLLYWSCSGAAVLWCSCCCGAPPALWCCGAPVQSAFQYVLGFSSESR